MGRSEFQLWDSEMIHARRFPCRSSMDCSRGIKDDEQGEKLFMNELGRRQNSVCEALLGVQPPHVGTILEVGTYLSDTKGIQIRRN